tara:strand:- start:7416 stop:9452 length:2037 start_codon:yes stop_codon:yes gene_type:complete
MTTRRRVPMSMLIDTSLSDATTGIQNTFKTGRERMSYLQMSKASLDLQDSTIARLESSIDSTIADSSFKKSLTSQLQAERERLYVLGYNSIGRDQTTYVTEQANFIQNVAKLQEGLALFDKESSKFNDVKLSGTSEFQISDRTREGAEAFMNDIRLNNGNNISVNYDPSSGFDLKYDQSGLDEGLNGKFGVNISNYFQSRELGGPGIIEYVGSQDDKLTAVYNIHAAKYKGLLEQVSKTNDEGNLEITNKEKFSQIRDLLIKDIQGDEIVRNNVNSDTMKFLQRNGQGVYVDDNFPGLGPVFDANDEDQRNGIIKSQADYIVSKLLPPDQITKKVIKEKEEKRLSQSDLLKIKKQKLDITSKKLDIDKKRKELLDLEKEEELETPGIDYVEERSKQLEVAASTNNTTAVEELLLNNLTSMDKVDKISIEDGNITITTEKVSYEAYSDEQIKEINNIAEKLFIEQGMVPKDIISSDGEVIDKDNLKTIISGGNYKGGKPKGGTKTKPSAVKVINDWTSPAGQSQILELMINDNLTGKDQVNARERVNEKYKVDKANQNEAALKEIRKTNLNKISSTLNYLYSNIKKAGIKNSLFGKQDTGNQYYKGIENLIKSLPDDYTLEVYDKEINPKQVFEKSDEESNEYIYGILFRLFEDLEVNPDLKDVDVSLSTLLPELPEAY